MGNGVVQTPHLDSLAASGCVFENAWVSNPVCMPNRATILTGRMPTAHGVIFNDRSLDWHANTFVRQLRADGYRTALLGKSHLQHGMSRNAVVDFRGEGAVLPNKPEVGISSRISNATLMHRRKILRFLRFEKIELSIDHGARVTGHHLHWALSEVLDARIF